jgi:hypothetical protein
MTRDEFIDGYLQRRDVPFLNEDLEHAQRTPDVTAG